MKSKIILFLIILILTGTIVSATENTDDTKTTEQITTIEATITSSDVADDVERIVKTGDNNNIKNSAASRIELEDADGECYYGARINYHSISDDNQAVNEGKVTLYVNNTKIATENIADSIDWMYDYQYNTVLDKYPSGVYPMKIIYSNDGQSFESNTATLNIRKGTSNLYQNGELHVDSSIIVPVSVIAEATGNFISHGQIKATYNNNTITTTNITRDEVINIALPSKYQQKTIQLTYKDNKNMLNDNTLDVYLDVIIPGGGNTNTKITINDAQVINITHQEDNTLVYDDIAVKINLNVLTEEEQTVTGGLLTAYHNNTIVARSTNTTGIIIPAKYNTEDINITYTGVDEYNNSSIAFTLLADKITTRTYSSYISAAKNTNPNIYPRVTSNTPLLYGKINVYIDNNHVKTINLKDDNVYISINNTYTTIGSTLDITGYDEGVYNLTFEVEENNIYTASHYTTTLTINKINTYIYTSNRTIYVAGTSNLYANVYANNRETINTGQMSFWIDDQLIATEHVHNNTAMIEYTTPSTLTMGEHTLNVIYEGDESYNRSNKQVVLKVAKTSTTTTLRTWTVKDEKIILNCLVRAYNKTINTGIIEAYINNKKITTADVVNNSSNITLPENITTDTTYNLRLDYKGTEELDNSTYQQEKFIFNKKNTTTRLYPYLRSNGTITLTAYVYSDNYAKVAAGTIIFTLDDVQIATAPVINNKANTTYDLSGYDAGEYTLKAVYNGSLEFKTSQNNTNLTKNPYHHTTYMTLLNKTLNVKRGSSTAVNATLTCYSRNITEDIAATITLNATWGTIVYTQNATFHSGVLNTMLSIPEDFELFTFEGVEISRYTLSISTTRSKNFRETTQSGTLHIGETTKIYQKTLWGYKNANITFNTTLQNSNGKQVNTNTTCRIDIYNTNKTKITTFTQPITNGRLEYTYQLPGNMTDDKYTVNITALSNKDYASSYKLVNITLNNRKTYINAANTQAYIDTNTIINGTIMDSITRSPAITKGQVSIQIDDNHLATVTAVKGVFKYTFKNNLTQGLHNLTITYIGDTLYANSSRSFNFTSTKNTLRISMPPLNAKIGDVINIKANITDNKGQPVKEPIQADILVNNKKTATNINITNGILSYTYNIPSGTPANSKITIQVHENNKYNTRNASTTLKINKDYQFITLTQSTITTSKGSNINITGNITDKNKKLLSGTLINIKIGGVDIANITSTDGKFNYEYTTTQNKGTYDILITAQETDNYHYNAKHMSLKVTS